MSLTIGPPNQSGLDFVLGEVGKGAATGLQDRLKTFHDEKQTDVVSKKYQAQGYPKLLADLAATATVGGKTEVLKEVLDLYRRGGGEALFGEVSKGDKPPGQVGFTAKEQAARQKEQEKRSFERNKSYLDRISKLSTDAPQKKVALAQIEGALGDKDFNSWRNAIAETTGQEWLKTASAQTVNSASKQYLMSSLGAITGRPNQYIERQITKALISPLYQDEANRLIAEGLKGLQRLEDREVEIAQDLEEDYTEKGKEIPRNFQKLVGEQLKEEARQFEESYQQQVKDLLSSKKDKVTMRDRDGNLRAVDKKDVNKAKKRGYVLVSEFEVEG